MVAFAQAILALAAIPARMTAPLTLHYAPDNASLCVRLALLECGAPFETVLVDRAQRAQKSDTYLALNPNGLIPVLVTPEGPIYETGAILLWIADRWQDLFPQASSAQRGEALKWLFWLSNTFHPALRMLFYPDQFIDVATTQALRVRTRERLNSYLDQLEQHAQWLDETSGILAAYLAPMLRWAALYGGDTNWFDLGSRPRLWSFAQNYETTRQAITAQAAEGLGSTPFSAPQLPNPPEGSAT